MDLKDQLKLIADRVIKLKEQIQTEEATKNAFVMPFLQSLHIPVKVGHLFRFKVGQLFCLFGS
jgi:hypothetical protein